MKKIVSLLLALTMVAGIFVGCGAKEEVKDTNEPAKEAKKDDNKEEKPVEKKQVKMFQFKVEIAEQLDRMKEDLLAETGIELEIETAGGGADYGALLKAKFASGEYPDVFNNGGYTEFQLWKDKLEDLSDQPWVDYLVPGTEAGMTSEGKLYGMPMNVEGYGFLYNVDLFEQAGIETLPSTVAELEEACKKLEAIGVTPFSSGYQEWWVLGLHNFNTYVANAEDPDALIKGLTEGTFDLQADSNINNYLDVLDLTTKYGQKNTLTVDYNTQVTEFAIGKTAMMQQGNWTQVQVSELNPEINVAVLPFPIKDAANDSVYVGVPNNWVIYNESPNKEAAKEMLNWMVTSETGKKYITDEFKFIPSFNNFDSVEGLGSIAESLQGYMSQDKVLGWHWFKYPDGAGNEIGAQLQAYIGGAIDRDGLLDKIEEIMVTFANK